MTNNLDKQEQKYIQNELIKTVEYGEKKLPSTID
jgi:hypothetical protein